jgi:hypothetical protein
MSQSPLIGSMLPSIVVLPIVAKKSKKRSKKNLRKPVECGLKRLSSQIIDHIQEATASEIQ